MATANLIWIPGWQFGSAVFAPLQALMPGRHHHVLSYVNCSGSLDAWLAEQSQKLPQHAHLIGWSLGGMLAVLLVQRRTDIRSVPTVCSNVQFAGPSTALSTDQAAAFRQRYRQHRASALRRFLSWVQSTPLEVDLSGLLLDEDQTDSLDWLYQINLSQPSLTGPVRAILELVPVIAASRWEAIGARVTRLPGGHDLPWRAPHRCLPWLPGYE